MASRKEQKEAARERRLAQERARATQARRQRRIRMVGGVIFIAVIVLAVGIAISIGGGNNGAKSAPRINTPKAKLAASKVDTLLSGIPQSGVTLGKSSAPVTVTEYGDLVCPVCRDFALSSEQQLISQDVRTGKVKLVYKPLETASQTANNSMFVPSENAVLAAGQQGKAWNYIELFYHEQGDETQSYVTQSYLQGLASQIPGLNYARWNSARQSAALSGQVTSAEQVAIAAGYNSTPTIIVKGPKSQAQPIVGNPSSFSQLESAIRSVQ